METIRVLLVDDDEDDYLLMKNYLSGIPDKEFMVSWAYRYQDAIQKIAEKNHDIYIYDFFLGAKNGLDLIRETKEIDEDAAIILLTGKGNSDIDRKATELGAMDYLIKSELDSEKVERSIRYSIERMSAIRALRESERKYRNIFDQSQDFIFLMDDKGTILDVNSAGSQILGYKRDEFLQMQLQDLMEETAHKRQLHELLQNKKEVSEWEAVFLSKSQKKLYCLLSLGRPSNEDNSYYQGTLHDVTEKKRLERNATLAEKMAASGRLVRTMGHEIRNPLTNINLALDQLEAELVDDSFSLYTDIIKRNVNRVNGLITDLLNSLKPTEVRRTFYPVHQLLDETIDLAKDRAHLKKVTVVKQYENTECDLNLDKSLVSIALLNIIINAIEAMSEDTGTLTIGTEITDTYCLTFIEDNGVGIKEEELQHLFEPYFTTKQDGMGLGLAATLNILQSHGATVDVESELGIGTKFTIRFPRNENLN
ncbi:PAS domain S-box protein [Cytophagaceae bacterium DM2B3-1]|uniref:histidine kinase n=1 Tax=Xanthocytophaga flava TaxID=3048013 RepID=A0ABT7CF98_9BACT|nr:PAS domain S-box protein [Xanthocytophaga flavus]MDJ1492312.1 PAS domain S-box protein [Xanthocytophaga flavus]